LNPGARTTLHAGDGALVAHAMVIDDRVLPHARYVKMAVTATTEAWPLLARESGAAAPHIRISPEPNDPDSAPPVGVVDRGTEISSLRLFVNPLRDLEKGEVLRVDLRDGKQAFFQIVAAKVTQQPFESSQGMQLIEVTAGQLGLWHPERCRFEPVNWVAPAGGLVFKVIETDEVSHDIPETSVQLGNVPNSSFAVHLNLQDAVTHNTAIIGVTGSGKTYLALHLIEALVAQEIRVLVLDVSRQHWIFMKDLNPFAIKQVEDVSTWLNGKQLIGVHQFADAQSYPQRTADLVGEIFGQMASKIQLRAGRNEPAHLCIVLEEAHSLIPEWNQVAQQGDIAQVNRTARTILQGRKYGLGCLLVSQRTANVTKTILNQCNTIFALQSFDQTGLDFLKNYMGEDYAHAISTLPFRHAILVGKASSSTRPILFEVSDLSRKWVESTE